MKRVFLINPQAGRGNHQQVYHAIRNNSSFAGDSIAVSSSYQELGQLARDHLKQDFQQIKIQKQEYYYMNSAIH